MNTAQLDNLESLEGKQLILRISGSVQQSNLADFEETANAVLESINLDLQTDEDFAEAEQNIKSCQLIETRLKNAKNDALNNTKEISDLISTIDRLDAKFRQTRLNLKGKVTTEKEARRNEIVDRAKNHLSGMLLQSPVRHAFAIDFKAIQEATKGKRSLSKMEVAVREVVTSEELRLANQEQDFQVNLFAIQKAERENTGLRFDDKNNLALSPPETVAAIITSRILQFKIDMQEKERKDREEAERKAEQERKEKEQTVVIEPPAPPEPRQPVAADPFTEWTPPPPPDAPQEITRYTIAVQADTAEIDTILSQIKAIPGIRSAMVVSGGL